jgi:hypothetical protein
MFIQIFINQKTLDPPTDIIDPPTTAGTNTKYPLFYTFPFYGPHRIRLLGYEASTSLNGVEWLGIQSRTMRNAAQVGPYLFVIPVSTSATDYQTRSGGNSYGWFECDLQGQVDFQLYSANYQTLIGPGLDVTKLSIVLSFEVEKLSELSTSHRRQN